MNDASLRLFAAVEIPQEWRDDLGRVRAELERLAPGEFKWVRPETMHLTLVFLGSQPVESLPALTGALTVAGSEVPPFPMSLGQVGFFGQPHSLQVIWAGLRDTPADLKELHRTLTAHLLNAGIPFDHRPLVPHITLARGRRPIDRAASLRVHASLQRLKLPSVLDTRVVDFVLMRSDLSRLGPSYEVIARAPLSGSRS